MFTCPHRIYQSKAMTHDSSLYEAPNQVIESLCHCKPLLKAGILRVLITHQIQSKSNIGGILQFSEHQKFCFSRTSNINSDILTKAQENDDENEVTPTEDA